MSEAQQKATRAKAADKSEETPESSTPPATPEPSAVPESPDRIPVERLMRDAVAFTGYPAHVLSGALDGDNRTELTPDEARAAAEAWLGVR